MDGSICKTGSFSNIVLNYSLCEFCVDKPILLTPYHAEFHKRKYPPSIFGTIHCHFRDIKIKNLVSQPTVYSLVRLHGCAGWPDSIMVAKANQFRC